MAAPEACMMTEFTEDDDNVGTPYRHIKIVGLHQEDHGRSCTIHQCCGKYVVTGDILRIKKTAMTMPSGLSEEALALTLVRGGEERCCVGFIPCFLLSSSIVQKNINKYVQVVELFGESNNTAKKQKDRQYRGVAGFVFIDGIPSQV